MRLRLVFIDGPIASPALAAASAARGHEILRLVPSGSGELAAWRGRMAAADAVILDADLSDLAAVAAVARASTIGMVALRGTVPTDQGTPAGIDLVLSPVGGPVLRRIARDGLPAIAFYPAVAPREPLDEPPEREWDLALVGGVGTRTAIDRLFLAAARLAPKRRFVVAGSHDAPAAGWPANVEPVPMSEDPVAIYLRARWSLHLAPPGPSGGFCPDRTLFEAATAGCALLCEEWPGLGSLLPTGTAYLPAASPGGVMRAMALPETGRCMIAAQAAARVAARHLVRNRALQLETLVAAAIARRRATPARRFALR